MASNLKFKDKGQQLCADEFEKFWEKNCERLFENDEDGVGGELFKATSMYIYAVGWNRSVEIILEQFVNK
jgi:hypothetical protein